MYTHVYTDVHQYRVADNSPFLFIQLAKAYGEKREK